MDPNEARKQMLEYVERVEQGELLHWTEVTHLADLFRGLDEWLSKGAALPEPWQEGRN